MIHTLRPAIFKPRPSFSTSISALVTKWSGDHFLKQNVPYFVRFVVLHYIEHLLLGRISKSRVTMDVKSGHIDSCLPRRYEMYIHLLNYSGSYYQVLWTYKLTRKRIFSQKDGDYVMLYNFLSSCLLWNQLAYNLLKIRRTFLVRAGEKRKLKLI